MSANEISVKPTVFSCISF